MNIALGVLLLLQIVGLVVLFFTPDFNPYNYLICGLIFKKDRKLWKKLISNVDDFHYEGSWGLNYRFSSDKYNALVWDNGECSIHVKNKPTCVLSSFDKRMSRKMAELLMKKVKTDF